MSALSPLDVGMEQEGWARKSAPNAGSADIARHRKNLTADER